MKTKRGFTLLEILVAVLIVAVLAAISVPWYNKTVEKMKAADALITMSAVSTNEHAFYIVNDRYSKNFADLDVDFVDKNGSRAENDNYETENYNFILEDNFVKAERANGEYFLYKLYNEGEIYCLPEEHYICQQYNWKAGELGAMDADKCQAIEGAWSNTMNTCYASIEERCVSLHGEGAWNGEFCGYTNTRDQIIGEGEFCYADTINPSISINLTTWNITNAKNTACGASVVKDGGECIPDVGGSSSYIGPCGGLELKDGGICRGDKNRTCAFNTILNGGICYGNDDQACSRATIDGGECYAEGNKTCHVSVIKNGGKCYGNNATGCLGVTVQDGGICFANKQGACKSLSSSFPTTYSGTGCCDGEFCEASAPKCYCELDPNTGRHPISC